MSYPPPQGYGAPGGYPPQGGYAGPPPTNGLATGALITGLVSVFCLPVLFVVAIPLGFMGLSKSKKLNGVGRGAAIGGLVAGFIGLLITIAATVILVIAAANADDVIDSASCSIDRIQLETAVESFQTAQGRDPADEAELVANNYLTSEVATYDFTIDESGNVSVDAVSGEGCD